MKRKIYLRLLCLSLLLLAAGTSVGQTVTPLLPVCPKRDGCGFIDQTGKIVIKPTFLDTHDFSEGLAAVKVKILTGEKYGFVDETGKIVIEPQFDQVWPFSNGIARFHDGDSYGFVDRTGKLLPNRYHWNGSFSEGLAEVGPVFSAQNVQPDHKRTGFIDTEGKLIIEYKFDSAEPFSEGLAAVCVDEQKCGYIDKQGSWVIRPVFEHAESFSEGFAVVAVRDGIVLRDFGYINRSGETVIPIKYSNARPFSEGLAAVAVGGLYGYIGTDGKMVIPTQYFGAYDFSDGLAVVLVESSGEYFKKYAYIDRTGKRISSKSYSYAGEFKNGAAKIEKRNFFAKLDVPLGKLMICTSQYVNKNEKSIWKETRFGCD